MGRVALLQLRTSTCVKKNLAELDLLFATAAERAVDLLVLPENFASMGRHETDKMAIAERDGAGEIQEWLSLRARQFGLWIIAGTLPRKGLDARVRASSLVFDNQGICVASYDKIHLFDVDIPGGEKHQESLTVEPGHTLTVVDTPIGCVGLSVCYDLRFPELYRQLVLKGAELFTVVSAFTATTGRAHWEPLLRARAIENTCYVLAPNQGGQHENGRETYGHSMIVDPWGTILVEADSAPGVFVADIDLPSLHALRLRFPCNHHHIMA